MINVKMRKIKIIANKIDCIVQDIYTQIESNQEALHNEHEELEEMMNSHEEDFKVNWKKEEIIETETTIEGLKELIDYLMDYKFK